MSQEIGNSGAQRNFRTDDNGVDAVLFAESNNGGKIEGFKWYVFSVYAGSSVAGGDKNAFNSRALSKFPCQGVFTAAAADYHDVNQWRRSLNKNPG